MPDPTPRQVVSDKCIAFSQTLLTHRRGVHSDQEALDLGQALFTWFDEQGALTEENAPIAARCIDLGVTLLKTSVETTSRLIDQIKESYLHYTP